MSDYSELDKEMLSRNLDAAQIETLEKVKQEGRVWDDLSEEYGVDNPDPPWRIDLESTCDALADGYWTTSNACKPETERTPENEANLDALERRWEEDQLVSERYADVPFPERQLLALAHSMIRRGLISEEDLAEKMKLVDKRLNMLD
ncbi:MAG: hypothetical protein GY799_25905 [Desulfobulbaceae bacterium]|nr:hypothetical protein [Desulfobulbaceae bacterium]